LPAKATDWPEATLPPTAQVAPLSMVIWAKLTKLVPSPASVPADVPAASSRALLTVLPMVLPPLTVLPNRAPGPAITRSRLPAPKTITPLIEPKLVNVAGVGGTPAGVAATLITLIPPSIVPIAMLVI
jgi:hypothetical protein